MEYRFEFEEYEDYSSTLQDFGYNYSSSESDSGLSTEYVESHSKELLTSAVMAEPFSYAESEIPQGLSTIEKKEISKAGKEKSLKKRFKRRKSYKGQKMEHLTSAVMGDSKIDLSGRGLRFLRKQNIRNLRQVVELDLSNNPLSPFTFKDLPLYCLKKLDLSGCGLTVFPWGLDECDELEELNLSNNPLDSEPRRYRYLPRLKKLDLSGCGLTVFPWGLDECDELEELNLSNNPLDSEFLYAVLRLLPRLRKLDLSGCGLTELPHALQRCWSLQELNLSNNFMEHSDLLEKLKSENQASVPSWYKSGVKPFVKTVSVFSNAQLPNLIKIVFEDAVYTKREGGDIKGNI